jgi:plasmid maintenance system killer protein
MGISHRTEQPLAVLTHSAIRNHAMQCGYKPSYKDFKIIDSASTETSLRIIESLHIKQLNPNLNLDSSAYPLQLT